jgi:hypothetical protein
MGGKPTIRLDLLRLLRDRAVVHPSRIVGATLKGGAFSVQVVGYPWWIDRADASRDHGVEFIFSGVSEGVLEPVDFGSESDEALEDFNFVQANDVPWAQPRGSEIYCNGALPQPLQVYLKVHDFLASHGSFRQAWQYLNFAGSEQLSPFIQITQTNSFLLGRFPPSLRNVVCAELDAQGVSYSELPTVFGNIGRLLVTIDRSQFFCETADAVFQVE